MNECENCRKLQKKINVYEAVLKKIATYIAAKLIEVCDYDDLKEALAEMEANKEAEP